MWRTIKILFSAPLSKVGALTAVKVWQVALVVTVVAAGTVGAYTYIRVTTPQPPPQHVIVFIGGLNTSMTNCHEDTFDDDSHSEILAFLLARAAGIANPYVKGCNGLDSNQNYFSTPGSMIHFSYTGGAMDPHGFWKPNDYQPCSSVNGNTLAKDVQIFDAMLDAYHYAFPNAHFTIVGHSLGGLVGLQGAYDYVVDKGNTDIDKVVTIDSPLKGVQASSSTGSILAQLEAKTCSVGGHSGSVVTSDLVTLGMASIQATHADLQCDNPQDPRQAQLSWCKGQQLAQRGVGVVTLGNDQDSLFCGGLTQTGAGLDYRCYTQTLGTSHLVLSKIYDLTPLPTEGFAIAGLIDTAFGSGHFTLISTPARELEIIRYILAPVVTIHQPTAQNSNLTSATGTILPFSVAVRCLWGAAKHATAQLVLKDGSTRFVGTSIVTDRSDTLAINGMAVLPASLKDAGATFYVEAGGDTCQYQAGSDPQLYAKIRPQNTDYYGGRAIGIPFSLATGSQNTSIYNSPSSSSSANPTNDANLLAHSAALKVSVGQTFDVYFDYENTGTTSWASSQGYQLVCDTKSIPGATCMGAMSQGLNGIVVPPGYQSSFYVTLTAPNKAGIFETVWSMAQKDVPFGQKQVGVQVNVTVPVTVPMPATQTSCPAPGPSRAAVVRPLALGNDDNVVYVKTLKDANGNLVSATLYRYDMMRGITTQILQVKNVDISDPQLSADGRWVIFISAVGSSPAIQMVRMDGQGLQTLYCLPATQYAYQQVIIGILLSPDQKELAFYNGIDQDQGTFSLLNMSDGTVQRALQPAPPFTIYQPVMWLNDTQLYLWRFPIMQSALFLMDTHNGPNQPVTALTDVAASPSLTSFDVSPDGTRLYISQCQVCGQGIFVGPSTISVQPAIGTTRHLIYTAPKGALFSLLAAPDSTTLFFSLESSSEDPSIPVDPSIDGVWKINVDGTGLTHLINGGINFALDNHLDFSHDGKWYLLTSKTGLFVSSLNGATAIQLASASDAANTVLVAVGWTSM